MSFRSRANPDQRRRRVLLEETAGEQSASVVAPRMPRRGRTYPDDALGESQPRVTDFLPGSWHSVVSILLTLAAADVACILLAWYAGDLEANFPQAPLMLIEANGPDSLARMCLASQCFLAAVLCPLLFTIRRRRLDDLRGTYRIWLWSAVLGALACLLCAESIQLLLIYGLQQVPSVPGLFTPRGYLWLLMGSVFLPLAIRLMVEMRRCRPAQILLAVSLFMGAASETTPYLGLPDLLRSTLPSAMTLVAATLLCASLLCYGRYVKLDAQGAFRPLRRKPKKQPTEEPHEPASDDQPSVRTRIDPPQATAPRPNSIGAVISAARTSDVANRGKGPLAKENRARSR